MFFLDSEFCIIYFIICKLLGFPEIDCQVMPRIRCVFKQLLQNNTLVSSLLFYSFSIMLFMHGRVSQYGGTAILRSAFSSSLLSPVSVVVCGH